MNATESFKDHQTSIFYKLLQAPDNEEIIDDDRLAFVQLHSGAFEIEIHVQVLQEFSDWVLVSVRFLLDDLDQVLECITAATIDNHGCGQVSQDVRTHCLDCIQIERFVQEHLNDKITALSVIEEDQDGPVDQPCPLLKHLNVGKIAVVVDVFPQAIQVFQGRLPVQSQNFGGQFAPEHIQIILIRL